MTTCVNEFFFFFNDTATTEIYTLSLHDALPICAGRSNRSSANDHQRACPDRRFGVFGSRNICQRRGATCAPNAGYAGVADPVEAELPARLRHAGAACAGRDRLRRCGLCRYERLAMVARRCAQSCELALYDAGHHADEPGADGRG